jgi:hypothetical protein
MSASVIQAAGGGTQALWRGSGAGGKDFAGQNYKSAVAADFERII